MKKKILFLDRDGVLNQDVSYLYKIEDFTWVPGAPEALADAVHRGYELIIVTNQSGIARGYYTVEDMNRLHAHMRSLLKKWGIEILDIFYCPHHKDGLVNEYAIDCNCRKPKPGMLLEAMKKYEIDKQASFLVGDSPRDVEAAEAAGLRGYLFKINNLQEFMDSVWKERAHEGL